MQAATTGLMNKVARLNKPIPKNGILNEKSRQRLIGEQCVVLRSFRDGLQRMLFRVVFDDGEERVLLETDVEMEALADEQGTN